MIGSGAVHAARLVELGRHEEARTALITCLAADPASAHLHGLMAQALLGLGSDAEALAHANQAVRRDPDSEWGHRLAATALDHLGLPDEATRAAAEAVRLAPLTWQTHQTFALVASAHWATRAQAAQAARRALELGPGHAGTHFVVGLVAQRRGDQALAISAYERVLAIEPANAGALNNLTVVRRHRRLGAAARGYGGSLRIDPQSVVARHNVEQLAVRFLRRLYVASLLAVLVATATSALADGKVGRATLTVAAVTVLGASTYAFVVLRAVPIGVRRFLRSRLLRQPILAATAALTSAMYLLAIATCLIPDGYAVATGLLAPLGLANLGVAIWSRNRSVPR